MVNHKRFYYKIETRGADEASAGFFLAIKFTPVESETSYEVNTQPFLKVFGVTFFQKGDKNRVLPS